MNPQERLQLDKLIRANDVTDNTNSIRELKHSKPLGDDIVTLLKIKKEYQRLSKSNPVQFDNICVSRCSFLFNNYTDIFNKIVKNELDLTIMTKLLVILKLIEDGKTDQHEGSVMVGKILKELYIDSAVKRADNIDKENDSQRVEPVEGKKISWTQFKQMGKDVKI